MKKFFGLMVMSLIAFLPLSTKAATSIDYSCSNQDANGIINCKVTYKTDSALENLTITLTEQGGADITEITDATDSDWSVSSQNELDNVWTVMLLSPGSTGEGDLFNFSYKASGLDGCKIVVGLDGNNVTITPPATPTETEDNKDVPEENKKTGATLPYVAFGVITLGAVGAYLATKNKAKMYKI